MARPDFLEDITVVPDKIKVSPRFSRESTRGHTLSYMNEQGQVRWRSHPGELFGKYRYNWVNYFRHWDEDLEAITRFIFEAWKTSKEHHEMPYDMLDSPSSKNSSGIFRKRMYELGLMVRQALIKIYGRAPTAKELVPIIEIMNTRGEYGTNPIIVNNAEEDNESSAAV